MAAIQHISTSGRQFNIQWQHGHTTIFPFIFLRDNCPCCRHSNGQKLIETATLKEDIEPADYAVNNDGQYLLIKWVGDNHAGRYSFAWLRQHSLNPQDIQARHTVNNAVNKPTLWNNNWPDGLPVQDYTQVSHNTNYLFEWLDTIKQYGFGILHNVTAQPGMVLQVAALFGYIRETNYGRLFDVKTVINPNNLAYTSLGISPHTDNPYRQPVPTLQLLHCLTSTAQGGDSMLVDGFNVAEDLRHAHPQWFTLLQTTPVTFCFKDKDNWLERTTTIIETDDDNNITAINFNNRSIQPFSVAEDCMQAFYEAYLGFARMLEDERYAITFKMQSGDLYIVNNRRILHARTAFTTAAGDRWLQGAYADIDGLVSKWRILNPALL